MPVEEAGKYESRAMAAVSTPGRPGRLGHRAATAVGVPDALDRARGDHAHDPFRGRLWHRAPRGLELRWALRAGGPRRDPAAPVAGGSSLVCRLAGALGPGELGGDGA